MAALHRDPFEARDDGTRVRRVALDIYVSIYFNLHIIYAEPSVYIMDIYIIQKVAS